MEDAQALYNLAAKKLDQSASKNLIHKTRGLPHEVAADQANQVEAAEVVLLSTAHRDANGLGNNESVFCCAGRIEETSFAGRQAGSAEV